MVQGMTPEEFAAELSTGLADIGTVRVENGGWDSTVSIVGETASGESKEYHFAESLQQLAERATIDEATWRSTWPDRSLRAASIAMLSVHVLEAIATGPDGAAVLRLLPGGVIAV